MGKLKGKPNFVANLYGVKEERYKCCLNEPELLSLGAGKIYFEILQTIEPVYLHTTICSYI